MQLSYQALKTLDAALPKVQLNTVDILQLIFNASNPPQKQYIDLDVPNRQIPLNQRHFILLIHWQF